MPERWLDGSTRPLEAEALRVLVGRLAGPGFTVERAPGGISTPVYLLHRDGERLYLRMSEEVGGSMRAEVSVHEHLREMGVSVPEVVAMDDAPEIGRGVMLVREIPGEPFAIAMGAERAPILRAAGRDLGVINSVAVDGFGWVRRDAPVWPPRGEDPTYAAFIDGPLAPLGLVADRLRTDAARRALDALFAATRSDDPPSRLAHGDFDATHIYQRDGRYTGVIDLGEMRGAEPHYDLAFFLVQDTAESMLPELLLGYAEVATIPDDLDGRLRRSATVIVATQLCRWVVRDGVESFERPSGLWWLERLHALLGDAS